jgi:heptosyltransferase-3
MSAARSLAADSRVLVIAGPAHGDILLVTPLLRSLRRALPDGVVDVLVYHGQSGILEGNPDVDRVLAAPKHPGVPGYLRLMRSIFRRYDLAISNKQTDRVIGYTIFAGRRRLAVVPADRQAWKRRMMTAFVPYDHENTHTLAQNNALGALLGLEPSWELRLPVAGGSAPAVDQLLASQAGRFAVLHVNPGLPHKRWTTEGWTAVAAELHRQGLRIFLTGDGSAEERNYLQSIRGALPAEVTDLSGRLRFAEVSELLSRSAVYVGTDTVTTHMAAAAGTPTVALFGPESSKVWGPWPRGYTGPESPWSGSGDQQVRNVCLLQSDVPCHTCRQGHCLRRSERARRCRLMETLDGEKAVRALLRLLDSTASTDPGRV